MSSSAPRLLHLLVCACVIGVAELPAAPQPSALHESAPTADSTILEQLPIDFIVNSGRWQTPARFVARRQYPMRSR